MPLTNQEMFDKVWQHFVVEKGKKSVDGDRISQFTKGLSSCAYHASSGARCPIGLFIPDEVYKPEMEGESPYALMKEYYEELQPILGSVSLVFLNSLQAAHDKPAENTSCDEDFSSEIEYRLREVAVEYRLQIPE